MNTMLSQQVQKDELINSNIYLMKNDCQHCSLLLSYPSMIATGKYFPSNFIVHLILKHKDRMDHRRYLCLSYVS